MKWIITGKGSVLLSIEGYSYTIPADHPMYTQIRGLLAQEDVSVENLIEYVDFNEACAQYGITVKSNGQVWVDGVFAPDGAAQLRAGVALGVIALGANMESFYEEGPEE